MIIPNKHSGYQAGIRLYPGDSGAGDGGGGGGMGVTPDFSDSTGSGLAGSNQSAGTNNFGESGLFGDGRGGLFGPVNTGGLSGYSGPLSGDQGGGGSGYGSGSGGDTPAVVNPPTRQTGYGSPTYNTQPIYPQPIYRGPTSRNYFNPAQQFNNNTSVYGTGRQYSNPYQPQQQYNPYQPQQQYNPYPPQQQYNPYPPQQQYNPYQPQQQYNPYQMQSPFSYQPQQRYNPYQQPQQSRRSPMGGRRYAEGGIAGILEK